MSDKSKEKARRAIESIINDAALNGDTLKNTMDFANFLEENEMIAGGEHGAVTYKDEAVCYMHLDGSEQAPGPWTIWLMSDYSAPHKDIPQTAQKLTIHPKNKV